MPTIVTDNMKIRWVQKDDGLFHLSGTRTPTWFNKPRTLEVLEHDFGPLTEVQ